MGRWQKLASKPDVICDTGHNVGGWEHISRHLRMIRERYGQIYMIVGMVNDKDIDGVLALMPKDASYLFTQASVQRAMPANDFAAHAQTKGLSGICCPTVREAIKKALSLAHDNDLIFIGGSTFIVADALPMFIDNNSHNPIKQIS